MRYQLALFVDALVVGCDSLAITLERRGAQPALDFLNLFFDVPHECDRDRRHTQSTEKAKCKSQAKKSKNTAITELAQEDHSTNFAQSRTVLKLET